MTKVSILILLFLGVYPVSAQRYITEKGLVTFSSSAPIENITAENKNATGVIEMSSMQIAFSVPVTDFNFEKKLMQEHFNEKYMETEKYPRATFQGQLLNLNVKGGGTQYVSTKGKLTIHGVTKDVEITGTAEITSTNKVFIKSTFKVKLKDFNITIPQLLWQNIAEEVEVNIDFIFKPKS